jgi:AraC-like DNA-binding protein
MAFVRQDWLSETIRECQVLAGQALPGGHRLSPLLLTEFIARIPEPQSPIEIVVLRGLLLDVCVLWGGGHSRNQDSVVRASRNRTDSPKCAFAQWATLHSQSVATSHPHDVAAELRAHLDAGFAQPVNLAKTARALHTSVRRLQKEFKVLTGVSIHEYVTRRRVAVAYALLRDTDDKVESIARAVGWSSRKNLNRALARYAGLTPADVRKRVAREDAHGLRRPSTGD